MAFQSQLHIAAALWKALRESPDVVPVMVRFGGTDEDKARALFARIADSLRVQVRTYPSEVFPNVMVDEMRDFVSSSGGSTGAATPRPSGTPSFTVPVPPGEFFVDPRRCSSCPERPCIGSCPTKFLHWIDGAGPSPQEGARCTGCLMCEATCLLDGKQGLTIRLSMPEVE
jgi:NAD-dependent dihydropyrimidine dehydrogenase PreA subunit